jgi:hypothetical protein
MSKVTVYHADNRWFIPASDGVREIPYAVVMEWDKAYGIEVKEVEGHV